MNQEKHLQLLGKSDVEAALIMQSDQRNLLIFTNAPYARNRLFTENNRIFIFI